MAAINNTEVGSQFRATVASGLSASAGTSYSLLTSANTDYLAFSAELWTQLNQLKNFTIL